MVIPRFGGLGQRRKLGSLPDMDYLEPVIGGADMKVESDMGVCST
jgi:hypothetical protein